jgi:hypothetical protein
MYIRILKYFDYMLDNHFLTACIIGLIFIVVLWVYVNIKSKKGGEDSEEN